MRKIICDRCKKEIEYNYLVYNICFTRIEVPEDVLELDFCNECKEEVVKILKGEI